MISPIRLSLFVGRPVEVVRLALNMSQVEEYNPPPNPAKVTDSRFEGYAVEHGEESWELDALSPNVIADLIEHEIEERVDQETWDEAIEHEVAGSKSLLRLATHYKLADGLLDAHFGVSEGDVM